MHNEDLASLFHQSFLLLVPHMGTSGWSIRVYGWTSSSNLMNCLITHEHNSNNQIFKILCDIPCSDVPCSDILNNSVPIYLNQTRIFVPKISAFLTFNKKVVHLAIYPNLARWMCTTAKTETHWILFTRDILFLKITSYVQNLTKLSQKCTLQGISDFSWESSFHLNSVICHTDWSEFRYILFPKEDPMLRMNNIDQTIT